MGNVGRGRLGRCQTWDDANNRFQVACKFSVRKIELILGYLCISGPKGSSYVYGNHDDEKVRNLEKKVSKLESEVTVLETAMADLAKRLLVVEQKSGLNKKVINLKTC